MFCGIISSFDNALLVMDRGYDDNKILVDRLREIAADLDGVYGRDQTGREHLQ